MAAPAQNQQGGDNSLAPLWITVGIFLLAAAIWYFAHPEIVWFVLKLRLLEIGIISLFTSSIVPLAQSIHAIAPENYSGVSFDQLVNISGTVGDYLSYPVAAVLIILAVVLYMSNPTLKYKKTYSMQSLIDEEHVDWPQITPILKLNLVEEDINKGPWAMALSPMQFAKKYELLQEEHTISNNGTTLSSRPKISVVVLREKAQRVFALQLGAFWTGTDDLKIHTKALFAAFAARIAGDREGSAKLLGQIARSTGSGKLDFSGVDELLKKHIDNKQVAKIIQKHAYVLTVMASMLNVARIDGVLASADFLWLKPVDRPLWFMLNTIGRQTPSTEVSGVFAHWLAELEFGKRLYVPMVDEAVNALEGAIKDIIYVPDEEEQQG